MNDTRAHPSVFHFSIEELAVSHEVTLRTGTYVARLRAA